MHKPHGKLPFVVLTNITNNMLYISKTINIWIICYVSPRSDSVQAKCKQRFLWNYYLQSGTKWVKLCCRRLVHLIRFRCKKLNTHWWYHETFSSRKFSSFSSKFLQMGYVHPYTFYRPMVQAHHHDDFEQAKKITRRLKAHMSTHIKIISIWDIFIN